MTASVTIFIGLLTIRRPQETRENNTWKGRDRNTAACSYWQMDEMGGEPFYRDMGGVNKTGAGSYVITLEGSTGGREK